MFKKSFTGTCMKIDTFHPNSIDLFCRMVCFCFKIQLQVFFCCTMWLINHYNEFGQTWFVNCSLTGVRATCDVDPLLCWHCVTCLTLATIIAVQRVCDKYISKIPFFLSGLVNFMYTILLWRFCLSQVPVRSIHRMSTSCQIKSSEVLLLLKSGAGVGIELHVCLRV